MKCTIVPHPTYEGGIAARVRIEEVAYGNYMYHGWKESFPDYPILPTQVEALKPFMGTGREFEYEIKSRCTCWPDSLLILLPESDIKPEELTFKKPFYQPLYTQAQVDMMLNDVLNGLLTKKYAYEKHSNGIAQFVIDYLKKK